MSDVMYCLVIHNDLAGNVFASMDRALSASSDDEEETIEGSEDQQPRQLQSDRENSSVVQSDELASNLSENVDEASVDEDVNDDEAEVEDENDVASVSSGGGDECGGSDVQSGADDGGGSDVQSGADDNNSDNASGISGKLYFVCCAQFFAPLFLFLLHTPDSADFARLACFV